MLVKNSNWLPHLNESVPEEAYGYPISMYTIGLEAWRRGITLKYINNKSLRTTTKYSLSYNGKEHYFIASEGDLVSRKAKNICRNKHLTKEMLLEKGVPVPKGKFFHKEIDDAEIIRYANILGYPLVLKPLNALGGRGVVANIKTEEEFIEALTYVKHKLNYLDLIVEKFFDGEDLRVYLVGCKVIAAMKRIPANVIGDGKNNIKMLLKIKNKERKKNPALMGSPIKRDKEMDYMLKSHGYSLDSVPKDGERVFLKAVNNISSGGEPIDVTEELTDEMKTIAENAAKAIPNLVQCGVDIMINKENNTAVVLEINSRPSIRGHLYPVKGKARDVPRAIIDYYFPETVVNHSHPLFYFDIQSVWELFKEGVAKTITIPNIPQTDLITIKFTIYGINQRNNYEIWVRRNALKLGLNGYIKHLKNGDFMILISGEPNSVNEFRKIIDATKSITKIDDNQHESSIKLGFEIINNTKVKKKYKQRTNHIKKDIKTKKMNMKKDPQKRRIYKKSNKDEISNDFYKKKYEEIINSNSWKITRPLRKLGEIKKKLLKKR